MKNNQSKYHQPVLLKESIYSLDIKPNGIYVDLAFGGGGHSAEILTRLKGGHLYAFDQDDDAVKNIGSFFKVNSRFFTFIHANFRYIKHYLKYYGVEKVDGILADLGVSSHQIDTPQRGFSTRFDGMLDMRMDRSEDGRWKMENGKWKMENACLPKIQCRQRKWKSEITAEKIVNKYSVERLHKIFGMYGEIRNARTLAQTIIKERYIKPIHTTKDLKNVTRHCAKKGKEYKYFAQVFQALRIEVNDELNALKDMLVQTPEVLKKDGKIAIISYHSLEDRLVKNFFNKGKFYGDADKDIYGNVNRPLKQINKKPIIPNDDEIINNNRARSAKLRIAVRI